MKIIILGIPGSGKDTQGELLAKKYKIPLISTGDILRHAMAVHSPIGKKVAAYIKKGILVPDKLIDRIVKARLKHKDCKKGFILGGFPRDIAQAKELQIITAIDSVIYLTIPKKEVIKRVSNRRVCIKCGKEYNLISSPPKKPGICNKCKEKLIHREDDKKTTIKRRLEVYKKQTKPLIRYYSKKSILKKIDGNRPINKIFNNICKILEK